IGTFISETNPVQVSTLSCSLHLKRIRRQARRLHNAHTRVTLSSRSTLGNKSRFCPPHGEVIRIMERGGRTGLSCQTASASNQI
ncbi:FNIP repeat-containing protein, partial [Dissostichus eleginoides]